VLVDKIGDWVDELADNMGKGELRIHDNSHSAPELRRTPYLSTFSDLRQGV
jgi:hypothetical protein